MKSCSYVHYIPDIVLVHHRFQVMHSLINLITDRQILHDARCIRSLDDLLQICQSYRLAIRRTLMVLCQVLRDVLSDQEPLADLPILIESLHLYNYRSSYNLSIYLSSSMI